MKNKQEKKLKDMYRHNYSYFRPVIYIVINEYKKDLYLYIELKQLNNELDFCKKVCMVMDLPWSYILRPHVYWCCKSPVTDICPPSLPHYIARHFKVKHGPGQALVGIHLLYYLRTFPLLRLVLKLYLSLHVYMHIKLNFCCFGQR